MSDLDNELLALAGGDISNAPPGSNTTQSGSLHHGATKKSKKNLTNSAKSKRRKTMEMDTESDMEMGSDSDNDFQKIEENSVGEDGPSRITPSTLYPYEGIYKDYADKQKILSMSELDREAILGDRQDEIQKIKDRENIKNMVRARDEASGKRYSAREKSRIGVTSEKSQKLDELKQKRQAKERRPKTNEDHPIPSNHKRNDWDDESEDGEIDPVEEQALAREERAGKLDDNATLNDIRSVMLTRARAAELCSTKFFEEYVKGMWVRVSVGFSKDDPKREVKYRVGEIRNVAQHRKYYQVEGQATKVALSVVLAKDEKVVLLDVVSNSTIQENEWMFLVGECQRHKVRLPSKKEISRKVKLIEKYKDWVKDESDITAQVKAKKEMRAQGLGPTTLSVTERLRLESERDQAAELGNIELHAQLTRQLEQASSISFKSDSLMSELNERNRKANREEIRRAELVASELRRQQMKALEAGAAVKLDPSARVRINPKLTYDAKSEPRVTNSQNDETANGAATSTSVINQNIPKSKNQMTKFEEMVATQVLVDIGIEDF